MDFNYAAGNVRAAITVPSIAPIWDNFETQAIPAAVLAQGILLTQYLAHLFHRCRLFTPESLWRWTIIHALFVTHAGFYRLGRDSRFVTHSENWFWNTTMLVHGLVLIASIQAFLHRRTLEKPEGAGIPPDVESRS